MERRTFLVIWGQGGNRLSQVTVNSRAQTVNGYDRQNAALPAEIAGGVRQTGRPRYQ